MYALLFNLPQDDERRGIGQLDIQEEEIGFLRTDE